MNKIIELRNVCKSFQMGEVTVPVLRDIDLVIKQNEFVSIMGPSGSGKSTLLDQIGLLARPSGGKVIIDGRDVSRISEDGMAKIRRKKIGFVFQTFNLISRLTALENVMLPMWFEGMSTEQRQNRATDLLEKVGLGDRLNHRPTQLSGGQRQRVAIARSLANDPEIILADEPTGNLDSKSGKEVIELLKRLQKEQKKTLIIVTHDQKIEKIAKTKYFLLDGVLERRK